MLSLFFKNNLPRNYIIHHLTHLRFDLLNFKLLDNLHYKYNFWVINLDSIISSIIIAVFFLFYIKYNLSNVRYNTILSKFQILNELIINFVLTYTKDIFGKINKFVFSLAFSVFSWISLMNLIGLLPIDFVPYIINKLFKVKYFIFVPSSDINITSSMSLSVLMLIFLYKIKNNNFLSILKKFFFHPFNSYLLIPINIILETVNFLSKIMSLSLRLFGNIYSGEIISILLTFFIPWWLQWIIIIPFNILHFIVSFLQSFIFMVLTLIYIS